MSLADVAELVAEVRAGRMVVIVDDEDRENEGDLIMAAQCVRAQDINFMVTHARGLVCLSLSRERCARLRLAPMVSANASRHHTNFTVSIEAAQGVTTGISAHDRAHTIRVAVAADAQAADLVQPGHVFPLAAQAGGVLTRAGHTEAASDLAALAGFEPAGVLVEILAEDGRMARRPQLEAFADAHGLKIGSIADLIRHRLQTETTVVREQVGAIDTAHGRFAFASYRDRISGALHCAVHRGRIDDGEPVPVRVHVRDALADALQVLRADGGCTLSAALRHIAARERGVVVLLSEAAHAEAGLQEIAPRIPLREAHERQQWRRHGAGAQILADLGVRQLVLLGTPRRYSGLSGFGLHIVGHELP